MKKTDLILGFTIGIFSCVLGMFLYINLFMHADFGKAVQTLKEQGLLGKIVALGAILDLIVFAILLRINKEIMARGVVLAVILLTIITLLL